MTQFALAQATDGDAMQLVQQCIEQLSAANDHTLGFLYVTSPLASDLGQIVDALKAGTSVQNWTGTAGYGICATATEYFDRPAIIALTGKFSGDEFRMISSITDPKAISQTGIAGFAAAMAVVHADPRNPKTTELVSSFANNHGVYLVGGLTSAESEFPQVAGTVTEGGLSGVLIGGRQQVAIGLTQGCSPIGPVHEITEAQGNVLVSLDDRPAIEALYEDAGIAMDDDPRSALANVHAAMIVTGSNTGDYLVRHLVGLDAAKGLVAIADDVSDIRKLMFVRRDTENADKDLQRMLDNLESRLSAPPKAGLYFSCLARGPQLFSETAHEMRAIQDRFGDIPIAGFFGNGEISNNRIYAYTGVLSLFS